MNPLESFDSITFDCYGTLIDWESGILQALRPLAAQYGIEVDDNTLLETYAQLETRIESGDYIPYKEVLREVMTGFASEFGWNLSDSERTALVDSIKSWAPFPDTAASLQALKRHFKLNIISNIDDDLFNLSAPKLGIEFDHVITAEQVRSYKPNKSNFLMALEILGQPSGRILHVAQSFFHDIIPAKDLGMATVWVNRRKDKQGFGATPEAFIKPDWEVESLAALVDLVNG